MADGSLTSILIDMLSLGEDLNVAPMNRPKKVCAISITNLLMNFISHSMAYTDLQWLFRDTRLILLSLRMPQWS